MMTMAEGDGGENCRVDQTQVHDVEPIHLRESIRKSGRDDGEPEYLLTLPGKAFRHEAIPDPGFGLDVLFAGLGLEFFAQLSHKDAEVLRLMC